MEEATWKENVIFNCGYSQQKVTTQDWNQGYEYIGATFSFPLFSPGGLPQGKPNQKAEGSGTSCYSPPSLEGRQQSREWVCKHKQNNQHKKRSVMECEWLTPVIPATWELRSEGSWFKASLGK
jgi:hypothetical protein